MTDAAEREMLYDLVRRFAREQIAPHVTAWDEAGEFPRQLYRQAAELGLLGIGYPEELGGTAATHGLRAALWLALQELIAPAWQQRFDLQAQQHRRRDGEDHPARTEAVGIGEQLHTLIVLQHTTDRLPAAHGIAQTLGQTQADQL